MEIVILLSVGFVAGALGGLLGIGGSVIMIPATALLLGWPFHLAQAVAMTVNPAVAVSATLKHHKNKNVSWDTTKFVLPVALVCICIAAWYSNQVPSHYLEILFGVFLIWVFIDQCKAVFGKSEIESHAEADTQRRELVETKNKAEMLLHSTKKSLEEHGDKISQEARSNIESHPEGSPSTLRISITGGATGTIAGLLGIGGGLLQVPLLNRLCGLPMKIAIGTSSSIMFITAIFGATVKDLSLPSCVDANGDSLGFTAIDAVLKALWLIPGALAGGFVGAWLTSKLPVKCIRIVFGILVVLASAKMLSNALKELL